MSYKPSPVRARARTVDGWQTQYVENAAGKDSGMATVNLPRSVSGIPEQASTGQDSMAESWIHRADKPLQQRALFPCWADEHVRWSDTDMIGHVNNLAFAAYLETGRALFLRHFTIADAPSRALFVLGEITIRFLNEAHWPADIDAGTGVVEIGRRTLRLGQGLFDGNRCIAVAESSLVLMDETTRKSRDIPNDVKDWLDGFVMTPAALLPST